MQRVKLWSFLFTSSIVSLVSLLSIIAPDGERDSFEKWILSVMSISIIFSFFGMLLSMMPPDDAAKLELPCIAIVFGFWCAGLPGVLNPDRELASGNGGSIINANLYFFSWTSMLITILLIGSWVKQNNGDDSSKTGLAWMLLGTASLVVMSSVSSQFSDYCPDEAIRNEAECRRAKFAVWLGATSGVMSLALVGLRKAPAHCQAIVALLLAVSWACGVSYITFGSGPGTQIGDVYFATWTCLFVSISILVTAINELLHPEEKEEENSDSDDDGKDEEDPDENDDDKKDDEKEETEEKE